MILIDLNQVMISNLMSQIGSSKTNIEEGLIRHMVLNTIRTHINLFRQYGKVVIACDNRKYWRRSVFENYKSSRKKMREDSPHDWNAIFECLNKIRDELKEFSPYTVIDVEGAEADDIIGILTKEFSPKEKVMILSSDKDFVQLHINKNVSQYSPILKKKIQSDDPERFLKEMIIRGDAGDGIPNILSDDNVFVDGRRQTPVSKKKLENWLTQDILNSKTENSATISNYCRNQLLIDLSKIPENIKLNILDAYKNCTPASKQTFMNYMIQNKLSNLLEVFDEF